MSRPLTALLVLCAMGLAACGSDDKAQVDKTVREFVKATNDRDANAFCDKLVSQQFLEQSTGAKGDKAREECHRQLRELKGLRVRLDRISSTKIRGDTATVRTVLSRQGQKQDQILRLRKEGGDWKLAGGAGG